MGPCTNPQIQQQPCLIHNNTRKRKYIHNDDSMNNIQHTNKRRKVCHNNNNKTQNAPVYNQHTNHHTHYSDWQNQLMQSKFVNDYIVYLRLSIQTYLFFLYINSI